MSTEVQDPPASPSPAPTIVAGMGAVPESAGVKPVDFNSLAESFQKAETKAPVQVVQPKENKPVVNADDAAPALPKGLASRIAEKNKPKVEATPDATQDAKKTDAAPAPEPLPEDKIKLDEGKTSVAARDGFKQLHGITKSLRQQIAEQTAEVARAKEELDAARKTPAAVDQTEIARLREEHKKLSDELMVTRLERHPSFQTQFVAPKNQALASAKELLGEKVKEGDLEALLSKPRTELGKAVQEITKDLPDMDRLDAVAHIKRAWELEQGGRSAMQQARATYEGIQGKSTEQNTQLFKTTFAEMAPSVGEHMVRLEVPADATLEERQSIDSYNGAMQSIEAEAQKIALETSDPKAVVGHSIKSALYDFHIRHALPRLGQEFEQMSQIISAQQKELAGYRSRNPNREISASPQVDSKSNAPKFDSYEQMAEHFATGAHKAS